MEEEKNQVTVVVTLEIRPRDPAQMDYLTSKILRYEIPLEMENVPLKFQLLKHGKQLIHEVDMPD